MSEFNFVSVLGAEIINVFDKIFANKTKTGIITCSNIKEGITSKIFIKNNHIVYANSTGYNAKLGYILVKKGIISGKELQTALKLQKEFSDKKLIGNILVMMGIISERIIPNILYHQIEAVIYEVLSWQYTKISFQEVEVESDAEYSKLILQYEYDYVNSDLKKLRHNKDFVADLKTNVDNIIEIRKHIKDPYAVPKRNLEVNKVFTAEERQVIRNIDGSNSINDLLIMSELDYFTTYKVLYNLTIDGVISIDGVTTLYNPRKTKKIETSKQSSKVEKNYLEEIENYRRIIVERDDEIKVLKAKINAYEETSLLFDIDQTLKIQNIPYKKRVLLSSIIRNVLDIIDLT